MSSPSNCPKCAQPVTIPDNIAPETRVRCPLCAAEYPLSDALAGVPPALIVVAAAAIAAESAELGATAEVPPLPAMSEGTEAESPAASESESELAPAVESSEETPTDGSSEAAEGAATEVEHELDLVSDDVAAAREGEAAVETAPETFDASAFAGIGEEPAGDGTEPPPGVPRWRTRRRAKEKNPIKEVIGVVLGGFFGLLIAYYALAWCGLASGLPDLKLPFLPSKQSSKPEGETKTEAEPDNAESRAPAHRGPFDRFAA